MIELSAPFNWCDRRCARCPLERACPIPAMPERPIGEILTQAVAILEEEHRRLGLSLEDLPPPPPPSLDAAMLREAAHAWMLALHDLEDELPEAEAYGF